MAAEKALYAKEDRRRYLAGEGVDIPFLLLVLLLLTVGLIMLYSASSAQSAYDTGYAITTKYLQKQAVCAGIGLVCMAVFSRLPAQLWLRFSWILSGLSIALRFIINKCILLLAVAHAHRSLEGPDAVKCHRAAMRHESSQ